MALHESDAGVEDRRSEVDVRHSEEGAEVVVDFRAGKEVCVPRSWSDSEAAEFASISDYDISERRPCEAVEGYDHVTVGDKNY